MAAGPAFVERNEALLQLLRHTIASINAGRATSRHSCQTPQTTLCGRTELSLPSAAVAALVVLAGLDDVIDLQDHLAHLQQQITAAAAIDFLR
jgi:hypothetical protein